MPINHNHDESNRHPKRLRIRELVSQKQDSNSENRNRFDVPQDRISNRSCFSNDQVNAHVDAERTNRRKRDKLNQLRRPIHREDVRNRLRAQREQKAPPRRKRLFVVQELKRGDLIFVLDVFVENLIVGRSERTAKTKQKTRDRWRDGRDGRE